jgi:flagellar biogenesis protein FliO
MSSSSEGTSWRSVLAALVLFAMGGGALYYQRRRRAQGPAAQLSVKVLGSAKVGPRAYAVVTSVGDHVLLLGVTDGSVRRLAWLAQPDASVAPAESPDEDEDDEAVGYVPAQGNVGNLSAAAFGRMLDQRLELHEREPTRSPIEPVLRNTGRQDAVQRPRDDSHLRLKPPMAQAAAKLEGKSKSFRDLVLNALDDKPANNAGPKGASAKRATQRLREAGGAAEAIANETRDVVRTTRSTRVEGQAAGLARLGGG